MLRTGIRYLCLAALSGALALTSANPALAGGHGHGGGGGGGGGGGWGGGGWGGGWGHGGWGYGGWGYGGYYRPYYSYGGYGYYPYYTYSYPDYYDYGYSYPYNYGYYNPSNYSDSGMDSGGVGKVTVQVPRDAQVTFNDLTSPEGHASRWYETPTLRGDQTKSVTIHAQWKENGAEVDRSRTIQLHAGDNIRLNFMAENSQSDRGDRRDIDRGDRRDNLQRDDRGDRRDNLQRGDTNRGDIRRGDLQRGDIPRGDQNRGQQNQQVPPNNPDKTSPPQNPSPDK